MNDLIVKALLAGLFFGIWPLIMNKSGLTGPMATVTMGALGLAAVSAALLAKK